MTRRIVRPRARQGGFTLIELMVALVVSSLLVGMILAIFMRMSIAYRGQQQVAEVQGKLAAARAKIEIDAKHAGLNMSNGFGFASAAAGQKLSPLRVINNATSPDELAFFYADTLVAGAAVSGFGTCGGKLTCDAIDSTAGFAIGNLVVASRTTTNIAPLAPTEAGIAQFSACVLEVTAVGPHSLSFSTAPPWGNPANSHCDADFGIGATMFYKLIAHAWRIDPARPGEGVLQLSRTGNLAGLNDWEDQGYGFTDIQVATRFYEEGDLTDTLDPDQDPQRDWYADETQETRTAPAATFTPPLQIAISLVARTERDVEGIASASTPNLTDAANPANNTIGDRAAIPLPSALPALSGNRIFRYTTFQVDLRNLGVGR